MSESYYLVQQINNHSLTNNLIVFHTMKDILEYSFTIFNSMKTYLTHTENTNEYFLKSSENENIIFFILEMKNYLV
jgi:hypothetical protein